MIPPHPEISILIPCFNAEPYLRALQQSLQSPPFPFAEILVYDDGSTDRTSALAEELGFTCLRGKTNAGVAVARNRLAAAARSDWIHFCDADDPLHPEFFLKLSPYLHSGYDVISCDADWIDAMTGRRTIAWRYDPGALASAPAAHLLENPMSLINSIIRKSSWASVGGCDERLKMWEDSDVHFRLARSGARFHHVAEPLARSIRRETSFSHAYLRNWQCRLQNLAAYIDVGLAPPLDRIAADELAKTADALLGYGDVAGAKEALKLARSLGHPRPASGDSLFRAMHFFASDLMMLRVQRRWRSTR